MPALPIVTLPDPILRRQSDPVVIFDKDLEDLARDLVATLKENVLLGMAAIMVGTPKRIALCAVDATGTPSKARILINPKLTETSSETEAGNEGCPSVPDTFEDIIRPVRISAEYQTLDGSRETIRASGLQARVIQHQVDLCDGILFIDRLSRLKRARIEKRLAKRRRQA